MMLLHEALQYAESKNPRRFEHILGVVDKATHLSELYGVSLYHAQIAASLHDYAKNHPFEEMKEILRTHFPSYLEYSTNIYHGPVGRYIVEHELKIMDPIILDAIEFHVTGQSQMSDVAKVVFVSDYIERGRSHRTVDYCRYLSEIDLDVAVLGVAECTLNYLRENNLQDIHPLSLETYETYLEKVGVSIYESIKNDYQRRIRRESAGY